MGANVYFGNAEKQVGIPAPRTAADFSLVGSSAIIQLANGGAIVEESAAQHREASFEWIGDPAALRIIREFMQGVYGPGPYYWTDPFAADTNLFAPNWAAPRLTALDWRPIYDAAPTSYVTTTTNAYGHPGKSAVYDLGTLAADLLPARRFTIAIPPGMALYFGASGSRTGTATIGTRARLSTGAFGAITHYVPALPSSSTKYLSSAVYSYSAGHRMVEIFLSKTSTAASTITLASMVAKLAPEGSSPTLESAFVSGEGSTGLRFSGGMRETLYTAGSRLQPRRKGFAVKLVETEAWEL